MRVLSMDDEVALTVALASAGVVLALIFAQIRFRSIRYLRREFLTEREFEFWKRLCAALPEAVVHCHVTAAALIEVRGGNGSRRRALREQMFDYVVCCSDGRALYAINLDDRGNVPVSIRKRDTVKENILTTVGLRLVRYDAISINEALLRRDFDMMVALDLWANG